MDSELNTKRIQSLTDSVFAVAMTILILEVRIPNGLGSAELSAYLLERTFWDIFIYVLGFITLGIFWIGSHFHHHHLSRTDRVSSWLNILFLMFICMIPFAISFLRNYRTQQSGIVMYSTILITAGFINYLMLWHAWRKKYIKPYFTPRNFRDAGRRIFLPVFCYLFIIGLSFFSTRLALYFFFAPLFLHLIPEKGNETRGRSGEETD